MRRLRVRTIIIHSVQSTNAVCILDFCLSMDPWSYICCTGYESAVDISRILCLFGSILTASSCTVIGAFILSEALLA